MPITFNGSGRTAEDPGVSHLVTAVYLGLLAALGVIGNLFVVVTVARLSQMQHMTYILVSNLSVVGLLNCVCTIPVHMIHILAGSSLWKEKRNVVCKALAHVNFGLILCTLINSAAIAVSRYRTVTARHRIRHQTVSTVRIIKLIFFIWAVPVLVTISASPFLGFNALLWDCFFVDFKHAFWYMNIALTLPALISTLCMLTAYSMIIKKVRDSRIKIANLRQKPVNLMDNPAPESREERTVSESDYRKDSEILSRNLETSPGSSNVGSIKIFTTMIPDQFINAPSTSYGLKDCTASVPGNAESDRIEDTLRPVSSSSQGLQQYLQLPPARHLSDVGMTARSSCKNIDTLPIPSTSVSSLPQDHGHVTKRNTSVLSSSSSTTAPNEMENRGKRRLRKELRLTMHLFLAFGLFCLLYLPLCLAHLFHNLHFLSREAWLVFYTLALSFTSNAWLVYALLNRDFRRAFRALLQGRRSF